MTIDTNLVISKFIYISWKIFDDLCIPLFSIIDLGSNAIKNNKKTIDNLFSATAMHCFASQLFLLFCIPSCFNFYYITLESLGEKYVNCTI